MRENPTIDWATGHVTIEKNGSVYTLPCHYQCLNNTENRERKRSTAEGINFISAKALKKQIQRGSSDDSVFLGLIQKVDEGTEDEAIGGDSNVENLRKSELPSEIWEVLESYSDVFPSELPTGVPPVRMCHESKIDLEDETPPIHKPLYQESDPRNAGARVHPPFRFPLWCPCIICTLERRQLSVLYRLPLVE